MIATARAPPRARTAPANSCRCPDCPSICVSAGNCLWGRGAGSAVSPRASARCRCEPAPCPLAKATRSRVRSSRLRFRFHFHSSLRAASFVLAARPAPEVCFVSLFVGKRGDRAPGGVTDPYVHAFLRRRGASRRAVAAFSFGVGPRFAEAVVFALPFAVSDESPANAPHPIATLLAGSPYWPPGGAPRPPGCVACLPRARAPVRSPRAGATGSRPSWERTTIGILSYRNIVKARNMEKNGAGGMKQCAIGTEKNQTVRKCTTRKRAATRCARTHGVSALAPR